MKIVIDIPDGYIVDGCFLNNIQNGSIACGRILKAVKNSKPYEERPTGHWIKKPYTSGYHCSNCLFRNIYEGIFCPNCGADMRGEKISNE